MYRPAQEPLGVPKINPDETSSSSEDESDVPIPRGSRRMSSIFRAEQAALSLSKSVPPLAIAPTAPLGVGGARDAEPFLEQTPLGTRVRHLAMESLRGALRRLLIPTPGYPGGIGGRLSSSRPLGPPSVDGDTGYRNYKMVIDAKGPGQRAENVELPWGMEAVQEGVSGTLSIRGIVAPGPDSARTGGGGGNGGGSSSDLSAIARIVAMPTLAGSREANYSVVLDGDGGGGEVMAVRITTHPTRLAAPRETRVVLLLPEGVGGNGPGKNR